MSVVAVKLSDNNIMIGCDSQVTVDWIYKADIQNKFGLGKILDVNTMLIGSVGKLSEISKMMLYATKVRPADIRISDIVEWIVGYVEYCKKIDSKFDPFNHWILVFKGKAFCIEEDLSVYEINNYCVIGSGKYHAMPLLEMGKGVDEAIKMSCKLDLYCSEPINIYRRKRIS